MVELRVPRGVVLAVVLVAAVGFLSGALLAGPDHTRHQSTAACQLCTTGFGFVNETTADPVAVTDSSLTVYLEAHGSLRYAVAVEVDESFVDDVESSPAVRTRLSRLARQSMTDRTDAESVTDLSVRVTGSDELTFTYRDPDGARATPSGNVVVTEFGIQQDRTRFGSRNLTLVAPADWRVTHERKVHASQLQSEDGRTTIVWRPKHAGQIFRGTYVAVAPERSVLTRIDAQLAVLWHTTPYILLEAMGSGLPVGLVYGLTFVACLTIGGRPNRTRRTWVSRFGGLVLTVFTGAILWVVFVDYTPSYRGEPYPILPLALNVGVLAFGLRAVLGLQGGDVEAARRRSGALVAIPAVAVVLSDSGGYSMFAALVAVIVVAFYLSAHVREGQRWFLAAILVIAPSAALLPLVPFRITDTPGFGPALIMLPLVVLGVAAYLVGANERVESADRSRGDGA